MGIASTRPGMVWTPIIGIAILPATFNEAGVSTPEKPEPRGALVMNIAPDTK